MTILMKIFIKIRDNIVIIIVLSKKITIKILTKMKIRK